jgi:hydrogenase maturation protease
MLVAGIGNIFLGDDGFGVEVAGRLDGAGLPDWVRVADYGISGLHLAYDLAEGYDTAILVDAVPRGGQPGTVYVLEVEPGAGPDGAASDGAASNGAASNRVVPSGPVLDGHGMQPDLVLGMVARLGAAPPRRVLVVGCEPASTQEGMGLSEPAAAAVGRAVDIVLDLVREAAAGRQPSGPGRHNQQRGSDVPGHTG